MTNDDVMDSTASSSEAATEGGNSLQFLTFTVGDEEYGVDIMKVREIKAWTETTRLPNSPKFMRGVLNLRGAIIPIFDLRCRFGMGLTDANEKNVVIILAIQERTTGILVDTVSDILTTVASEIKPAPKMETIDNDFLGGLIALEDRMVTLLDVDYVFRKEELTNAMDAAQSVATTTES